MLLGASTVQLCTGVMLHGVKIIDELKEGLAQFMTDKGFETVQEIVLGEDSGAALLERFRIAKAAVRDPWLERDEPYHPRQFADLDGEPIVGAPAGAER